MKRIIKTLILGTLTAVMATGCVNDDDFNLAPFDEPAWAESFDEAVDNTPLDITGWTNFAQTGTTKWTEQVFDGNGYAEFSTFNSGNAVNVGWLITPPLTIDGTSKTLIFQAAQHHLDSPQNTLQVYVSSNYNGTDVAAATWTPLTATLPTQANDWYEFVSSGPIDLSAYSGNVYIGFKVTGSGTDQTLDGAYQIDNVKILK